MTVRERVEALRNELDSCYEVEDERNTILKAIREAVSEERARCRTALLAAATALESVQADEGAQEAGLFQGPMIGRTLEVIRECLGEGSPDAVAG